jgi:hypothetical protein
MHLCAGCGRVFTDEAALRVHVAEEQMREAENARVNMPDWVRKAIAREENPWRQLWRRINAWGRD